MVRGAPVGDEASGADVCVLWETVKSALAWPTVERFLAAEVGGSLGPVETLGKPRPRRLTWAAETVRLGHVVVKARWSATNLPRLGARGYPVPEILWHVAARRRRQDHPGAQESVRAAASMLDRL
jgi:hypothetical protein